MRQYLIPYIYRDQIAKQLQLWESWGINSRGQSELLIVVVKKKTGGVRICLDARALNNKIIKDLECPMPLNELLFQPNREAQTYTSIDLTVSYWQIELHTSSRQYTAFQFNNKTYLFNVIPFRLTISVASFS